MIATSSASERLQTDLIALNETPLEFISAGISSSADINDVFTWNATLLGPSDTPYVGGLFFFVLIFPKTYPSLPPSIRCTTKVYHPNIAPAGGELHLPILAQQDWPSSEQTVSDILRSMCEVFINPITKAGDYIQNHEQANLYKSNKSKFNEYAKDWTKKYAMW